MVFVLAKARRASIMTFVEVYGAQFTESTNELQLLFFYVASHRPNCRDDQPETPAPAGRESTVHVGYVCSQCNIPTNQQTVGRGLINVWYGRSKIGPIAVRSTYGLPALSSPTQTQLHRAPLRRPSERRMNGWDGHSRPTGRPPATILLYKSPK